MATKSILAHKKMMNASKNKSYIYTNRKDSYMCLYTFCGLLEETQIKNILDYCLNKLIRDYPEKSEKFKKCFFKVKVLRRMDKSIMKYRTINLCHIYCSDYEVGSALCGFDFDCNMLYEPVIFKHEDKTIDPDKEIKSRSIIDEDIDIKKYEKIINSNINKISETNKYDILNRFEICLTEPVILPTFFKKIYQNIIEQTNSTSSLCHLIGELILSEIIRLKDEDEKLDENVSDKWYISLVHYYFNQMVTKSIDGIPELYKKDEGNAKVKNLLINISSFYNYNLISHEQFYELLEILVGYSTDDKIQCESYIRILANLYLNCYNRIDDKCRKYICDYFDDYGDITIENIIKNAERKKYTHDKEYGTVMKFKNKDRLVEIPAIKLKKEQSETLLRWTKERDIDKIHNTEHSTINPLQFVVEPPEENEVFNKIISEPIHKWVDKNVIENLVSLFNSNKKHKMNFVWETCKRDENLKICIAFFSNENVYSTDASFAVNFLYNYPLVLNNSKSEKETHLISFKRYKKALDRN